MRKYQIARPYIDKEDIEGVVEVLKSGWLSLGPKYLEFEKNMASYVGAKYACALSSGTAGLHLAVKALGIQKGDEVITSPFSFVASSNCIIYEGAKPVFADIKIDTFNMDPKEVEKAITKKTKAILVVHIFGQSADMDEIIRIAKKYNLKIIEDACESLGARYKGRITGTMGEVGVYSFYPNKQMTTGEGAMVVTDSKKINDLCCSLRNQGRNEMGDWLIHQKLGYNYRIDEMSASLGVTQLKKIDWMIEKRREIATWYNKELSNMKDIMIPMVGRSRTHSWFVYVIRITNGKRDDVLRSLNKVGIQTKAYLPSIHLQPFMVEMYKYKRGDFPASEKVSDETLALPLYIGLKLADVKYITAKIKKII